MALAVLPPARTMPDEDHVIYRPILLDELARLEGGEDAPVVPSKTVV